MLHYGGRELTDICDTLLADTDETYKLVKVRLDAHFEPQINHRFEAYIFRCMRQEEEETVDQYRTRLKSFFLLFFFLSLFSATEISPARCVTKS